MWCTTYIDKLKWEEASLVVSLFNDWFDFLNTQQKYNNGVSSYGLNENVQNESIT